MYYNEFFKLCGYTDQEIEIEAPRIEKVFDKAGIGPKEVDKAVARLEKYFWVESLGIRKALGIWVKQFLDLVLAREEHEKLVYYSFPIEPRIGAAINCAGYFASTPEFVLAFVLGYMFGMLDPYYELSEKNGMPQGIGMCGVNRIRVSSFLSGLVPLPDLFLVSSFLCDNEGKTDELIGHHFPGIPRIYIDNSMDSQLDDFENTYPDISMRRVKYFGAEVEAVYPDLEKKIGVKLSPEHIKQGRIGLAKGFLAYQKVGDLMMADPPPLSNNDLMLFSIMAMNPERRAMAEGPQAMQQTIDDAKKRIAKGEGVVPKGTPKVAWVTAWFADPEVNYMVDHSGLIPICSPFYWTHPKDLEAKANVSSDFEKSAMAFLRLGLFHSGSAFTYKTIEIMKHFDVDGLLWLYGFPCRPCGGAPMIVKKTVEERTGMPVLTLEADWGDARDVSLPAMRTRLETFAEILKMRKAANQK